jgi:hypothetical protein
MNQGLVMPKEGADSAPLRYLLDAAGGLGGGGSTKWGAGRNRGARAPGLLPRSVITLSPFLVLGQSELDRAGGLTRPLATLRDPDGPGDSVGVIPREARAFPGGNQGAESLAT